MNELIRAHPDNVEGSFYVEYGCCTACGVPEAQAPIHFAYDANNHCYVSRQPETAEEIANLIQTAWRAELGCIRYRGTDADILRRFAELDLRGRCDVEPPRHIKPLIRNHVSFSMSDDLITLAPQELAAEFVAYLHQRHDGPRRYNITPIRTSGVSASFEFAWFNEKVLDVLDRATALLNLQRSPTSSPLTYHSIVFERVTALGNAWHTYYPIKNVPRDHGVGNIVTDWLSLNTSRFTHVRWYADDDWNGERLGQATRI